MSLSPSFICTACVAMVSLTHLINLISESAVAVFPGNNLEDFDFDTFHLLHFLTHAEFNIPWVCVHVNTITVNSHNPLALTEITLSVCD